MTDEFKSSILFIKNHSVNRVQNDRDLSAVEEKLELLPVILLLAIVLSIREGMHRNISREVAREDFSHQEAVVEGAAHILDRVGKVQTLDPLKHFTRKTTYC